MISAPPRLETSRLILDAHQPGDLDALAAMWAEPEVVRYISGVPSSREQSWSRLLRYAGLWPMLGYGYWAVREKATGRFIGDVGFADFLRQIEPSIAGLPEAGWVFAGWAHGRGLASEALGAALAWLDATAHRRSVCLIEESHAASINVALKNGFAPDGAVTKGFSETLLFHRDR